MVVVMSSFGEMPGTVPACARRVEGWVGLGSGWFGLGSGDQIRSDRTRLPECGEGGLSSK